MNSENSFWNFNDSIEQQTHLYRLYHENSKHSPLTQTVMAPRSDYYKFVNSNNESNEAGEIICTIPPVDQLKKYQVLLTEVLENRRSSWDFGKKSMSEEELINFLGYSFGISNQKENLRTYPSGGRFYPVDVYIVPTKKMIKNSKLINEEKVYKYNHNTRQLVALNNVNLDEVNRLTSATSIGDMSFDNGLLLIFLVGDTSFIKSKYLSLSYRLIYQELGHIGQNIMLVSTMLGFSSVPLGGFFENKINKYLNLDSNNKSTMYTFIVG